MGKDEIILELFKQMTPTQKQMLKHCLTYLVEIEETERTESTDPSSRQTA